MTREDDLKTKLRQAERDLATERVNDFNWPERRELLKNVERARRNLDEENRE